MNVYDFDHTIYDGDCTLDFWFYCLKYNPWLIRYLPIQLFGTCQYLFGLCSKEIWKEKFYSFFAAIPEIEKVVVSFWDTKESRFFQWYHDVHRVNDLVISASPDFIVREGCRRLGITNVIASPVDKVTGKYSGKNCRAQEKLRRFQEHYDISNLHNFYSDSKSDVFMAEKAKRAYLVCKGKVTKWPIATKG